MKTRKITCKREELDYKIRQYQDTGFELVGKFDNFVTMKKPKKIQTGFITFGALLVALGVILLVVGIGVIIGLAGLVLIAFTLLSYACDSDEKIYLWVEG